MERTWMPIVGGILSIIAGGLSLVGGLLGAGILSAYSSGWYYDGTSGFPGAIIWAIFTPYFIICALAIAGGVFALQRKIWGLALAGAIAAFFTVWDWPLGVAAIVLIAISKREFDHHVSTLPPPPVTPPPPSPPPTLPPVVP